MRSEWIPLSAAALITGAMALVLSQMLNPSGSNESPVTILDVAANSSERWLAMSILFFVAAVAFILGLPSVLSLFTDRGRKLGLLAVATFALGSVGLAGFSSAMVMFRALAVQDAIRPERVQDMLSDPGLAVMIGVWTYGFLGGVLLLALALFRAKKTPVWVPLLFVAFLALQFAPPAAGRVVAAIGLLTLAAGFTGIATTAASPEHRRGLAGSTV